ncbi:MAG TPA: hypothetical protein PL124_12235 [Candidatus Cloacimonadota bacterium]|nr:hypothetical protein [Candidatus Cloacimonadota bacterium]HPS40178.1 hypothetical protein [Candidatus Cloacimonadota bacterium]
MLDLDSIKIRYKDFGGSWERFIDEAYQIFERDFIIDMPLFRGHYVDFSDKRKLDSNKEEGFWHLTSRDYPVLVKGKMTKERKPDFDRTERIRWIKEIIENSEDSSVLVWLDPKSFKVPRYHLWYNKEFLVVLNDTDNSGLYSLITSFYTCKESKKRWYWEEYCRWK